MKKKNHSAKRLPRETVSISYPSAQTHFGLIRNAKSVLILFIQYFCFSASIIGLNLGLFIVVFMTPKWRFSVPGRTPIRGCLIEKKVRHVTQP